MLKRVIFYLSTLCWVNRTFESKREHLHACSKSESSFKVVLGCWKTNSLSFLNDFWQMKNLARMIIAEDVCCCAHFNSRPNSVIRASSSSYLLNNGNEIRIVLTTGRSLRKQAILKAKLSIETLFHDAQQQKLESSAL